MEGKLVGDKVRRVEVTGGESLYWFVLVQDPQICALCTTEGK